MKVRTKSTSTRGIAVYSTRAISIVSPTYVSFADQDGRDHTVSTSNLISITEE